jgi:hypothetical protein
MGPWCSKRSSVAVTAVRMGENGSRGSEKETADLSRDLDVRERGFGRIPGAEPPRPFRGAPPRPAGRPCSVPRGPPARLPREISLCSRGLGSPNPLPPSRLGPRAPAFRGPPAPPTQKPARPRSLTSGAAPGPLRQQRGFQGRSPRLSASPGTMTDAGPQRSTGDRASH